MSFQTEPTTNQTLEQALERNCQDAKEHYTVFRLHCSECESFERVGLAVTGEILINLECLDCGNAAAVCAQVLATIEPGRYHLTPQGARFLTPQTPMYRFDVV